jgi:hypothetical protein
MTKYLAELDGSDIFVALLIPNDESQIMRVVAVLIYLECYVFARVATWDTVCREIETELIILNGIYQKNM